MNGPQWMTPFKATAAALLLLAVAVACGGGSHLLPAGQGMSGASPFAVHSTSGGIQGDSFDPDAGASATLLLTIKVPKHGKLYGKPTAIYDDVVSDEPVIEQSADEPDDADAITGSDSEPDWASPDFMSPGTLGVGVTVLEGKKPHQSKVKKFFKIKKGKGCKGGGTKPIVCTVTMSVPSGKDTITIDAYAKYKARPPILASDTIKKTLKAGKTTKIKVSLKGNVRYVYMTTANAYPPVGSVATIPIVLHGIDAYGFFIIGKYASSITLSDSDKTGVTKLSSANITASTSAAKLTLAYNGKTVAPLKVIATSKGVKHPAQVVVAPGGSGLVAMPAGLFVDFGTTGSQVQIAGVGANTGGPYTVSAIIALPGDPSCKGIANIAGVSPVFMATPVQLGICAFTASDTHGHTLAIPAIVQPEPDPSGNPAPTPTPIPNTNQVIVNPNNAVVCQKSNAACVTTSMNLNVSQIGFTGVIAMTTTCGAAMAALTPALAAGPSATFQVTGGSSIGACTATFQGSTGKSTTIVVTVTGANSNAVVATPTTVSMCPSSGASACTANSKNVAVTQISYTGTFAEGNNCPASIATVTPITQVGPNASYAVTGGSTTGTCQAIFYGAGAQTATVDINIVPAGTTPIVASPTAATVCPTGCSPNTASVTISQAGYTGNFGVSTTCAAARAVVTPTVVGHSGGPSAAYTITGGSSQGRCTATWTGSSGQQVSVTVDVTSSGWTIDTTHKNHTR